MTNSRLLVFRDCSIGNPLKPALSSLNWELHSGEAWLITGSNGSGKSVLASAAASRIEITPNEGGEYLNNLVGKTALVSFEEAAALIEQERYADDSDFIEGGVDEGQTARSYIASALNTDMASQYPCGKNLENHPAIRACAVEKFLDRGLKRLSTGEIRRTLLCRALASDPKLLILDEPFEGLDTASRESLATILDELALKSRGTGPQLILVAHRWLHIPEAINRVAELTDCIISFCGGRSEYEALLSTRKVEQEKTKEDAKARKEQLEAALFNAEAQAAALKATQGKSAIEENIPLVEMKNVVVEYSGKKVLDGINWTVHKGEHWLLRGPNGSGKTTLLELIAGDNPQVFRNDIKLFGKRRGTGETIWDLKKRMGLVSYRLHLEYRYLNDCSLLEVLVSGLKDSIGLYEAVGDTELALAKNWLNLAGFEMRGEERFGHLSFGEQRAILVARAAMKESDLLILDEPCHGLDEEQRNRVLNFIQAVAEHGVSTIIHVTHDPSEVLPCEKQVLELRPDSNPAWAILSRDS